jgi:hypothetical protein
MLKWKYWRGKIALQLILTIFGNLWKLGKLNYKSFLKIFGLEILSFVEIVIGTQGS